MEFQNVFTSFIRQAAPAKPVLIQFNSIQPQFTKLISPRFNILLGFLFLFLWSFLTKAVYTMSCKHFHNMVLKLTAPLPNKHSYGIVWLITMEQKAFTDSRSHTVQSSSHLRNKSPSVAYCNVYGVLEVFLLAVMFSLSICLVHHYFTALSPSCALHSTPSEWLQCRLQV